jgi:hypothetical protein
MCDEDVYLRIDGVVIDAKLLELQMAHHGWACVVSRLGEGALAASEDHSRGALPICPSDLARRVSLT